VKRTPLYSPPRLCPPLHAFTRLRTRGALPVWPRAWRRWHPAELRGASHKREPTRSTNRHKQTGLIRTHLGDLCQYAREMPKEQPPLCSLPRLSGSTTLTMMKTSCQAGPPFHTANFLTRVSFLRVPELSVFWKGSFRKNKLLKKPPRLWMIRGSLSSTGACVRHVFQF